MLRAATWTPTLAFDSPPGRLTGGFWAELVAFRLRGAPYGWQGDLVARVMPDPRIAAKETAIQTQVAAQGFPTPSVHLAGGPDDGLGRAFMVMDHAKGRPLLGGLGGLGAVAALPRRRPAGSPRCWVNRWRACTASTPNRCVPGSLMPTSGVRSRRAALGVRGRRRAVRSD